MGFRESLLEEREKEKEDTKSWKVIAKRVLANFFVVLFKAVLRVPILRLFVKSCYPIFEASFKA